MMERASATLVSTVQLVSFPVHSSIISALHLHIVKMIDAIDCNNHGTVDFNGNCDCSEGYAGSNCEYSGAPISVAQNRGVF